MVRLPRYLPSVAIACCLTVPVLGTVPSWAQQQNGQATQTAIDSGLKAAVENFWHYGKIARYDLAVDQAKQILTHKGDPQAVLAAFEQTASSRKDDLDAWMLRWQGVDEMRDVANELIGVLTDGHRARRSNPQYIQENIDRLSVNERAYALALQRLRESGELAVPQLLDVLRDPSRSAQHSVIRRALNDLGKQALNPLVVATQMKDAGTLATVASILGGIGYQASIPYLAELAQSSSQPDAVKQAAANALRQMGAGDASKINVAQQFYALANQFYASKADISADSRNSSAFVWYWDDQKGLFKKDVPFEIFNDILALRASAEALKLDPKMADAVSLWLAADYKREADLPEGSADPTRLSNEPDAHYYGVAAGSKYLSKALAKALSDRNSAVALRALQSLEQIAGQSNLFGPEGQPIVDALRYQDRLVRFEAAMTLATSLPQQPFEGSDQVIHILSEALLQTGQPQVVVVDPSQDTVNKLVEGLKGQFGAAGATQNDAVVQAAANLPFVDAVIVNGEAGAADVDSLRALMNQVPKLRSAVLIIRTQSEVTPFNQLAINDPTVLVTQAADAAALTPVVKQANARSASLPIDQELATAYALRSASLLERLAVAGNQVLPPAGAQSALLHSLADSRAELAQAAGKVLALIAAPQAQRGLIEQALAQATPQAVKISLFKSAATNAKFYGNQLTQDQIDRLLKVVLGDGDLAVRSAAAEARGALNLPADEAAQLILGTVQAK